MTYSSSATPGANTVPIPRQRITRRARLTWALTTMLAFMLIAYFAVGAVVAQRLTLVKRKEQSMTPAAFNLPFEDVQVTSRDGLTLAGWYIPAPASDRAVLLVHGKDSCRSCEFSGNFVEFASRLQARGYHILMIDLRGHGQSSGERFTLGDHERRDVLGALDWLKARGFSKIGALGVSMGAASTVKAAVDSDGGQAIQAIVLDSGFGELRELLNARFPRESGLPNLFLDGALLMGRIFLQTDMNAMRPLADLPRIQAPILLIFSAQDDLVPVHQFEAMSKARPNIESWLVQDAGHAYIYREHRQEYVDRVSAFFDQHLR